jgi:hypothetical protein
MGDRYSELENLIRDLNNKLKGRQIYIDQNQTPPWELEASINSLERRIASLRRLIDYENKRNNQYESNDEFRGRSR